MQYCEHGEYFNELSTYSSMRNIYIVRIYILMKTCTKHDIGLEVLVQSPNHKMPPINEYSD
jgi:hypothetical protein